MRLAAIKTMRMTAAILANDHMILIIAATMIAAIASIIADGMDEILPYQFLMIVIELSFCFWA